MIKLRQCDQCKILQNEYEKIFLCSKCFNTENANKKIARKHTPKSYHHKLTVKFENVTNTMNTLLDQACDTFLINQPKGKFSVTEGSLGSLEDLNNYKVPLILMHLNLAKQTKLAMSLYHKYLITNMLDLFTLYILPRYTVFLPEKMNSILEPKPQYKILLLAILSRSEFFCKFLQLSPNRQNINPTIMIDNLFFYQCYKNCLAMQDVVNLELIQSILLIADLEVSIGYPLAHLNAIKAMKYAHTIYLHDLKHPTHRHDNLKLKVEKLLTWLNCMLLDHKLYFFNHTLRPSNHVLQISCKHLNNVPLEYKKWINHVQVFIYLIDCIMDGIRIKNSISSDNRLTTLENPWDAPSLKSLDKIISLFENNPLSELPSKIFQLDQGPFNPYHSAIISQYTYFHLFKILACDLFNTILSSPQYLKYLPNRIIQVIERESSERLTSAMKILSIATEDHDLPLLTSYHLQYLEVSHFFIPWAYFYALRALLSQNHTTFNNSELISIVVEKLKTMTQIWPTTQDIFNIITRDLEARGISLTYHDLKTLHSH